MAVTKLTQYKLMDAVSKTSAHMVHGGYDEAFAVVCDADTLHFYADEQTDDLVGAQIVLKKPRGLEVVIDTMNGIISASLRGHVYSSRVFADNAGYLMAASDIFSSELARQKA